MKRIDVILYLTDDATEKDLRELSENMVSSILERPNNIDGATFDASKRLRPTLWSNIGKPLGFFVSQFRVKESN